MQFCIFIENDQDRTPIGLLSEIIHITLIEHLVFISDRVSSARYIVHVIHDND